MGLKGANVVLAARSIEKLEQICNNIKKSGGSALAVPTDLTQENDCKNLINLTIQNFHTIDMLILNAGVSMWAPFEEIEDISFFNDIMNVNYMGSVYCVHAALPELKKSKGKIVSITTAQAIIGFAHHAGYSASKHALHGFLETLDMELEGAVSFMNTYLGWIKGTSLRQNAYGADGEKIGQAGHSHDHNTIELNPCTDKIIQAIQSGKKTVYIPGKLRFISILNMLMKKWLHKKILNTVRAHDS